MTDIARPTITNTENRDAAIFEMVRRHDEIRAEWDGLRDDHPRIANPCTESIELAHRILMYPVRTSEVRPRRDPNRPSLPEARFQAGLCSLPQALPRDRTIMGHARHKDLNTVQY
jgi:hypothetical protein